MTNTDNVVELLEAALKCTPSVRFRDHDYYEVVYDCGNPFDLIREALQIHKQTMYLDRIAIEALSNAAKESNWIPEDYVMDDIISDCCRFIRGCDDSN